MFNLRPRERASEIRQTPACFKHDRLVLMDIVHQEDPIPKPSQRLLHTATIELLPCAAGSPFQSFQDAGLVSFRLQPPDEPGAGVGQPLVVEIDGILRGQHHSKPECPRLLEQRHQWQLGGRI